MATQGQLKTQEFDTASGNLKATFIVDTSINAPTIIYASKQHYYPNGYQLAITASGVSLEEGQYEVEANDDNHISVKVTDPKYQALELTIVVKAF